MMMNNLRFIGADALGLGLQWIVQSNRITVFDGRTFYDKVVYHLHLLVYELKWRCFLLFIIVVIIDNTPTGCS